MITLKLRNRRSLVRIQSGALRGTPTDTRHRGFLADSALGARRHYNATTLRLRIPPECRRRPALPLLGYMRVTLTGINLELAASVAENVSQRHIEIERPAPEPIGDLDAREEAHEVMRKMAKTRPKQLDARVHRTVPLHPLLRLSPSVALVPIRPVSALEPDHRPTAPAALSPVKIAAARPDRLVPMVKIPAHAHHVCVSGLGGDWTDADDPHQRECPDHSRQVSKPHCSPFPSARAAYSADFAVCN